MLPDQYFEENGKPDLNNIMATEKYKGQRSSLLFTYSQSLLQVCPFLQREV